MSLTCLCAFALLADVAEREKDKRKLLFCEGAVKSRDRFASKIVLDDDLMETLRWLGMTESAEVLVPLTSCASHIQTLVPCVCQVLKHRWETGDSIERMITHGKALLGDRSSR